MLRRGGGSRRFQDKPKMLKCVRKMKVVERECKYVRSWARPECNNFANYQAELCFKLAQCSIASKRSTEKCQRTYQKFVAAINRGDLENRMNYRDIGNCFENNLHESHNCTESNYTIVEDKLNLWNMTVSKFTRAQFSDFGKAETETWADKNFKVDV
jgi:hypothetical protein